MIGRIDWNGIVVCRAFGRRRELPSHCGSPIRPGLAANYFEVQDGKSVGLAIDIVARRSRSGGHRSAICAGDNRTANAMSLGRPRRRTLLPRTLRSAGNCLTSVLRQ